jgi:hypothetical protein
MRKHIYNVTGYRAAQRGPCYTYRQRVGSVARLRAMHCTACGAELTLTSVVPEAVPGVERHTFICSACHVTEHRVVFMRHGREDDGGPMPIRAPPCIMPSTVREEHFAVPGFFGRVMARIRGH